MSEVCDVIVVGAGMAGASVAAALATDRRVVILERERQPGVHATGRSAALFTQLYGNPIIRNLTAMSRSDFDTIATPDGNSLMHRCGTLYVGDELQRDSVELLLRSVSNHDVAHGVSAETAVSPVSIQ